MNRSGTDSTEAVTRHSADGREPKAHAAKGKTQKTCAGAPASAENKAWKETTAVFTPRAGHLLRSTPRRSRPRIGCASGCGQSRTRERPLGPWPNLAPEDAAGHDCEPRR